MEDTTKTSVPHASRASLVILGVVAVLVPHSAAALCSTENLQKVWFGLIVGTISIVGLVICAIVIVHQRNHVVSDGNPKLPASRGLKVFMIASAVLLLLGATDFIYFSMQQSTSCDEDNLGFVFEKPTSFIECAAAGYIVQESYPRRCTANGVMFTETITNSNNDINANVNAVGNANTNSIVSTAGWNIYTNTVWGFSMKFPPTWNGYTVTSAINVLYFTHPKKQSNKGNPGAVSFVITRLVKGVATPLASKVLKENNTYTFVYSPSNAATPDEMIDLWNQIDSIAGTFTLTE